MLLQILWNPDPEIISLFGKLSLRYYSILFASGLLIGFYWVKSMYKKEGLPVEELDTLFIYIFLGTVLGARIGHCLFYEPEYYLSHPLEMILPFRWENGFEFTGFRGLASHGGILAVFIAIWLFARKYGRNFWAILDKVAIAGALAGACIRLGNFMNSEIIGKATGGDWGVVFQRVDDIPRHPAQLYESMAYLLICLTLWFTYKSTRGKYRDGFVFGLFFFLLFVARFIIEYFKINQVAFEEGMMFNMGQLLSIPGIILGLIVMYMCRTRPVDQA